jgi:hypothetical protein
MLDKLSVAILAQKDIDNAVDGWRAGMPTDEIAFLNRLTENLKQHRACGVGTSSPSLVFADFHLLHRAAPDQSDLFGADLAATVWMKDRNFLKTMFVQLKKSKNNNLRLYESQLKQATKYPIISDRSFVFSADEVNGDTRAKKLKEALNSIPSGNDSTKYDTRNWRRSISWIFEWLDCNLGAPSNPQRREAENFLLQYLRTETGVDISYDWAPDDSKEPLWLIGDIPENFYPARTWIIIEINTYNEV